MDTAVRLAAASYEAHGSAILDILNESIASSTAVWDYEPRSAERMREWFAARASGGFPVLAALDAQSRVVGYASFGPFRPWPGYKYTVEHSVFVRRGHHRRGIGRALLGELIGLARRQQYHVMVGAIDGENAASIALHESLGFRRAGAITEAGFKHRRWLDVVFYQLTLDTPSQPVEGG